METWPLPSFIIVHDAKSIVYDAKSAPSAVIYRVYDDGAVDVLLTDTQTLEERWVRRSYLIRLLKNAENASGVRRAYPYYRQTSIWEHHE